MKTITLIAPNFRHIESASVCKGCDQPIAEIDLQESPIHDAGYYPQVTCHTSGCNLQGHTLDGTPAKYAAKDVSKYRSVVMRKVGA